LLAYQKPTVNENASIIINGQECVYPLYADAAIKALVKMSATYRLYVTLVNKITNSPGKINPAISFPINDGTSHFPSMLTTSYHCHCEKEIDVTFLSQFQKTLQMSSHFHK